jgi:hypothetical protein
MSQISSISHDRNVQIGESHFAHSFYIHHCKSFQPPHLLQFRLANMSTSKVFVVVLIAALAAEMVVSDNLPLAHVGTSVVQGSLGHRLLRIALSAAGPKRRLHDVSMCLLMAG